jgi:phosphate uptake regulator
MNERIQALAEQADLCFINHEGKLTSHFENFADMDNEVKKFAELIIRECAELTLDHKNDDYYTGWLDYRDEIKKHFGVDE